MGVMPPAFAAEAARVHDEAFLSDTVIAEATGASPSTVRAWLARKTEPTGTRARRLAELAEVVDRLKRVMNPDYIAVWLVKPIEALGDDRPTEVIARGDVKRVTKLISGLESPGAA